MQSHISIEGVKSRSVVGIITLISRSFVQRAISIVGFLWVAYYLGPTEFGIFSAINGFVSILSYFSDIGLAASLVQKKDQVTVSDLRATFTFQQTIVLILIIISVLFSSIIFNYYHIESSGKYVFFSLLLGFFLASLKTIPSVILERSLRFEKLAIVELIEAIIFYGLTVLFASKGLGVGSYAVAVCARGIIGTALLYKLSPWPIGLDFSFSHLRSLLKFGIPYQINSLLAVGKDQFIGLALWKIIGSSGLGVLNWAQNLSQLPLRFIMDNVTKVTFPAISRLQDHPEDLKKAIEKTLFFITFLSFPLIACISIFTPSLMHLVPRYQKWSIALFALNLYCINSLFAVVSTPLTSVINALGKVKTNTCLMIMWTTLSWILMPLLAIKYGADGVAIAVAIISITSIVPVIIVRRLTKFNLSNSISPPVVGLVVMSALGIFISRILPPSWPNLIVEISASLFIYLVINLLMIGKSLILDLNKFVYAFKNRHNS